MSILVGLIANLYYIVLGRFCLLTCMIIEKVALLLAFTDRFFGDFVTFEMYHFVEWLVTFCAVTLLSEETWPILSTGTVLPNKATLCYD